MAKFTSTSDLNIRWNGLDLSGSAGTELRIPDALYEEFDAAYASLIPGLTWTDTDEAGASPPFALTDTTGLTAALAAKADVSSLTAYIAKTGDTATGPIIGPAFRPKGDPVYNVKAYGAVGDGVADDGAIIQSLVTTAQAAGGGTIFFPAGTYRTTSTITMQPQVGLRGVNAMASILSHDSSTGYAINYPHHSSGLGELMNGYFTIKDIRLQSRGSGFVLGIHTANEFSISNVRVDGEIGSTGSGIQLENCYSYTLTDIKVRSFPSGAAIQFNTTSYNSGGVVARRLTVSTCAVGYQFVGSGSVFDTGVFEGCGATNCTDIAVSMVSAAVRNVRWIGTHLEATNTISGGVNNTAVGIYQTGTDCQNIAFEGLFLWGMKTPINLAGTVNNVLIGPIYSNTNSHASPDALVTTSAQCTKVQFGSISNNGYPVIADNSDPGTRRKTFAGSLPIEIQLGTAQAITNSATVLTGLTTTLTPDWPERWVVQGTVDANVTSAGTGLITATIVFDGSNTRSVFWDPVTTGRNGLTVRKVISGISQASHTVELRVSKANAGGTASAIAASTALVLERTGE